MMRLSVVLPADDGVQAHVFHAAEDVVFDVGIGRLQLADQRLGLHPLGVILSVVSGCAGIGEFA